MATTKAFELAQLSANVTSTTGLSTLATGIVSSEKIGAGIAVPLGNIHSKSAINNLLILESEDNNADIIGVDTSGSTRLRSAAGAFSFWAGGDASSTGAANSTSVLTIADDGIINVASTASSSGSSTGALMVAGGVGVGENLYVGGNIVISGDLTVEGTSVTLNTTDLNVEDKNITLNYHASNDTSASAGGAGITIQDAVDASNDASILWDAGNDEFDISHDIKVAGSVGVTNIVTDKVVKFNGSILDDSNITDTGSLITLGSNTTASANLSIGGATATTAILSIPGADTTTKPQIRFISGLGTNLADAAISTTDDSGGTSVLIGSNLYYSASAIARFDTSRSGSAIDFGYTGNMKFYTGTGNSAPSEKVRIAADGGVNWSGSHSSFVGELRATDTSNAMINAVNELAFYTNNAGVRAMHIDNTGKVGIGTADPDALLHISDTSPHIDLGPHGGNRGKIGYHNLDVIIGSTSGTGSIIFKNNISSTGAPQTDGDVKMTIADGNVDIANKLGVNIASDSTAIFRAGWASSGTTRPNTLFSAMIETNSDQDGLGLFTTDDRNVRIIFGSPTNNVGGQILYYTDTSAPHMKFFTRGSEVMALKEGKVGIGTDAPVQTLDVDGSIGTRQVRHSIRPSLNLDFANSKELDSRITFYRDSIATYYDSKGTLKYANINEPRFDHDPATGESKGLLIEEARTNLFTYTNNPERWPLMSGTSSDPIANNIKSPDGTFNATSLIIAGSDPYFYKNTLTLNGTYTFSYWIKAFGTAIGKHYTTRVTNVSSNSNTAGTLPSEWTRYTFTFTTSSTTTAYVGIEAPDNSPADGDEISIWGAQLELGDFATSLIPSDTRFTSRSSTATYHDETGVLRTAPVNGARHGYKYDGRKWVETGLILEAAATNLYSSAGNALALSNTGSTTDTPRYATAPDSSLTALRIQWSSGYAYKYKPNIHGNGVVHTHSMYVKPISGNTHFRHGIGGTPGSASWSFDFDTQTTTQLGGNGTTYSYTYEKLANGWWRVSVTFSLASSTGYVEIQFSGSTSSTEYYLWGVQVETGYAPTSFIPSPAGSPTRSADVASSVAYTRALDSANMYDILYADWNREEEGTFYVEHEAPYDIEDISVNYRVLERHNGITGNSISILNNAGTNQLNAGSIVNTGWQALMGVDSPYGELDKNTVWKTAIGFKENDFGVSMQGSPIAQDSSGLTPVGNHTLSLGNNFQANNTLNGHLKLVKFYPERLSNAELVSLTENN